jgi:hypothetical protein
MLARLAIAFLCAAGGAIAWLWLLASALTGSERFWRIAIGFDQTANAAIGGSEDLTISTRAAIGARNGKRHWCVLCRLLDAIDPGHCARAERDNV